MFQNNYNSSDNQNISFPCSVTPEYQMPNPTSWNIRDLDWNFDGSQRLNGAVTQFTASSSSATGTISPISNTSFPCKRKPADTPSTHRPTKQFISERKMIEHMNSLHLSSSFTNHNISPDEYSEDPTYNIFMSPADLEQKLKNAQRITVCQQLKNLNKNDSILPKALVDRVSTPSPSPMNALVLWQPPTQILKVFGTNKKSNNDDTTERNQGSEVNANIMESEEINMDNNNCLSVNFNTIGIPSDMDLDL